MQDRALSIAANIADKQIPNYKVAFGLGTLFVLAEALDMVGLEKLDTLVMLAGAGVGVGMGVYQYGWANSVKAAREYTGTLFGTVKGYLPGASQPESAPVVKKTA